MILAIDIGNTNIVVGCIDDRKTYFIERLSTNRTKTELEYAVDLKNVLDIYHIKKTEIEGCIISSVVPQITNIVKLAAEKILKKNQLAEELKLQSEKLANQGYELTAVRENIAFGLKMRKIDKATIEKKVQEAAEILDLGEYLDKKLKY